MFPHEIPPNGNTSNVAYSNVFIILCIFASPITTKHAVKGSVFVNLKSTGNLNNVFFDLSVCQLKKCRQLKKGPMRRGAARHGGRVREGEPVLRLLQGGWPDPSFRALSGRLQFTVRRHKFNKDSSIQGLGCRVQALEV